MNPQSESYQTQQSEVAGVDDIVGGESKQYLTFFLDGEEYGVDILGVQEIRGWEKPTI